MGRRWCTDCCSRQQVVDTFTDSVYEPWGEQGYQVTALACGHTLQSQPVTIGPAPGEPYAGRPTVASCRSRDLLAVPLSDPFLHEQD